MNEITYRASVGPWKVACGLLAGLCLVLGTGCTGFDAEDVEPARSEDTVEIGLLMPLSGSLESFGFGMARGADLAAKEINSSGGVLGKKIRIVSANTETDPNVAPSAVRTLIDRGVSAVVGAVTSSATLNAATMEAIPSGMLMVSPASTSPVLTDVEDQGLLWRTAPSDAFQGKVAAQMVYNDLGIRTAGVMFIDNPYGQGLSESFKEEFDRLGGRVLSFVAYPEMTDAEIEDYTFTSEAAELFTGSPELIYLITYYKDGAKITIVSEDYVNDAYRPLIMGCDANFAEDFLINASPVLREGMIGTVPNPPLDDPLYIEFSQRYENAYGVSPSAYGEAAYDAVYLIAYAMLSAGSFEPTDISAKLQSVSLGGEKVYPLDTGRAAELLSLGTDIDYDGASGVVEFDAKGDITSGTYMLWKVEQGQYVTTGSVTFP